MEGLLFDGLILNVHYGCKFFLFFFALFPFISAYSFSVVISKQYCTAETQISSSDFVY